VRNQRSLRTNSRRCGRGFTAGMAAANHHHVENQLHRKALFGGLLAKPA
jgi:hypothetical protein